MAKMIPISFKDNEEDLYRHLKGQSSPSIYIKEILKREMNSIDTIHQPKAIHDMIKESKTTNTNLSSLINVGR